MNKRLQQQLQLLEQRFEDMHARMQAVEHNTACTDVATTTSASDATSAVAAHSGQKRSREPSGNSPTPLKKPAAPPAAAMGSCMQPPADADMPPPVRDQATAFGCLMKAAAGVVPGLRTGAEPLPGHAVAVWSDIVTEQIQLDRLAKQRKNEARMVFDWVNSMATEVEVAQVKSTAVKEEDKQ